MAVETEKKVDVLQNIFQIIAALLMLFAGRLRKSRVETVEPRRVPCRSQSRAATTAAAPKARRRSEQERLADALLAAAKERRNGSARPGSRPASLLVGAERFFFRAWRGLRRRGAHATNRPPR